MGGVRELDRIKRRVIYLRQIIILLLSVLLIQAFYLQVIRGGYYRERSRNNSLRVYRVKAARGRVYSRNGVPLAINRPCFNLYVVPGDLKKGEIPLLLGELSKSLGMNAEEVKEKISDGKRGLWSPVLLRRDISQRELALIEEKPWSFPGTMVVTAEKRLYPQGALAAHVLGYLGEVTEEELAKGDFWSGDMVGRSGVEKEYQNVLQGLDGWEQWEVDARGRKRRLLDSACPVPGSDIYLTLDVELQRRAEELLKGKTGAIVVMDPVNGDILAMASSPGFDPNIFSKGISVSDWDKLSSDKSHPLQNRCIQGLYPPGSIFKIVVSLAGLEDGRVKINDTVFCSGGYRFGGRVYHCWRRHGKVNMRKAIVESCDVYFYDLGKEVGVNSMHKYAVLLGLGKKTGVDLPHEKDGLVPSSWWKKRAKGESWYPGETLSLAIGQGYLQVTPLQLALMISEVANGGWRLRPHVLMKVGDQRGRTKGYERKRLPFKRWNISFLKDALLGVVQAPDGTGKAARVPGIDVAGKTGTAQVVSLMKKREKERRSYDWRAHACFVAFAPADMPEIAVSVLVEHGGHGGSSAAPLAADLIRTYLKGAE